MTRKTNTKAPSHFNLENNVSWIIQPEYLLLVFFFIKCRIKFKFPFSFNTTTIFILFSVRYLFVSIFIITDRIVLANATSYTITFLLSFSIWHFWQTYNSNATSLFIYYTWHFVINSCLILFLSSANVSVR